MRVGVGDVLGVGKCRVLLHVGYWLLKCLTATKWLFVNNCCCVCGQVDEIHLSTAIWVQGSSVHCPDAALTRVAPPPGMW